MPYVTSLILNPARVYPKAVAVVEKLPVTLFEIRVAASKYIILLCGCGGIGRLNDK
jgi:hypothetical protein